MPAALCDRNYIDFKFIHHNWGRPPFHRRGWAQCQSTAPHTEKKRISQVLFAGQIATIPRTIGPHPGPRAIFTIYVRQSRCAGRVDAILMMSCLTGPGLPTPAFAHSQSDLIAGTLYILCILCDVIWNVPLAVVRLCVYDHLACTRENVKVVCKCQAFVLTKKIMLPKANEFVLLHKRLRFFSGFFLFQPRDEMLMRKI